MLKVDFPLHSFPYRQLSLFSCTAAILNMRWKMRKLILIRLRFCYKPLKYMNIHEKILTRYTSFVTLEIYCVYHVLR